MKIDVLTLFPAMFVGPLDESIIKRARQAGLLDLQMHQLRHWTHDRHKTVADRPFGAIARELAQQEHLLIVTGHYEGFDERIRVGLADDELSIGDYVLTNGALPAMVVIDTVARLLPGVLGDDASSTEESFSHGLLEYPQWTRPAEFRGMKVPDVLVSGNHAEIAKWRVEQAKLRTKEQRPDLI